MSDKSQTVSLISGPQVGKSKYEVIIMMFVNHALATLGILWRGIGWPPKRAESSKGPIKPLY
jgi:hypothetical protein